jgi:hypothetical protein
MNKFPSDDDQELVSTKVKEVYEDLVSNYDINPVFLSGVILGVGIELALSADLDPQELVDHVRHLVGLDPREDN